MRKTYRKGADGVDGELVGLSVRHDGQTCGGEKSEGRRRELVGGKMVMYVESGLRLAAKQCMQAWPAVVVGFSRHIKARQFTYVNPLSALDGL
jgi:hypothetical protein